MTRATDTAEALRAAFDASFAAAPAEAAAARTDLLVIRIGDAAHAVRLSDVRALAADRRITPLPGAPPALLGVAGLRGAVVPVYDLHALLGRPPCASPRWMLLAGAARVGLAFERFDGYLRVAGIAGAAIPIDGQLVPIVDVGALIASLAARARGAG